jgi:hypothetical protein
VDGGRRRFKEREYKVTRRNKRRREIPKIDHRTRSLPSLSSVGHFFSSTIASASTGIPNGNPAHPTALLELFPAGPNTSMNKLARPFTTAGCFVYSDEGRGRVGVELKGASGVELKGIACGD